MFGKLLKYDFRSMFKQFAFIWPAALAIALVNHFTLYNFGGSGMQNTVSGFAVVVYIAILIAMFIIALVFTIQRFYKGLLGDEGYLMFTLPVKPWQLIGSKLLCAVITTFISVIVALLSVLLLLPWDREAFREIFEGLRYVSTHWSGEATQGLIALLEMCLMMMVSFATGYLHIYAALSIGHLFSKNRIAISVAAFVVLNSLVGTLSGILMAAFFRQFFDAFNRMSGAAQYHCAIWTVIVSELLLGAVYFAGTEFILRKKLNLE